MLFNLRFYIEIFYQIYIILHLVMLLNLTPSAQDSLYTPASDVCRRQILMYKDKRGTSDTSESDVCMHQILTFEDGPRTIRIKICLLA